MRVATTTKTRKPTEDIAACTKVVMTILQERCHLGSLGVTAGWIADRGIGFSEYAIGAALRRMASKSLVTKSTDGGHVFWRMYRDGEKDTTKKSETSFGSL